MVSRCLVYFALLCTSMQAPSIILFLFTRLCYFVAGKHDGAVDGDDALGHIYALQRNSGVVAEADSPNLRHMYIILMYIGFFVATVRKLRYPLHAMLV